MKLLLRYKFSCCAWLFGIFAACSQSSAPMSYPFPTKSPFSPPELAKRFGVVTVEQDPDPAIHYKLLIPLDWGQVKGTRRLVRPEHPFELRSHFKALSGPEAQVKVSVAYVPEEVAPSDWLRLYLDGQQERVLHERQTPQAGGAVPDVLTIGGATGQERISRWVVLKDHAKTGGAHFFMLQASTAPDSYTADMADVFYLAVSHFNVLHPTNWPYAELQLRSLVRTVPARLSTVFPLSWEPQENPHNDEHLYQIKLTKQLSGRSIGLINLMVLAGQTEADLRRLEEATRAAYAAEQLAFKPAEFTPAPAFGRFEQVYTALTPQTNAAPGTPAQERHVMLARSGPCWVYLENVRFAYEAAPEEWAVSKRAFEIVQENLVVGP